jgi:acyl-coenzyme A synthetase/AMP-(fatty) acid ligase
LPLPTLHLDGRSLAHELADAARRDLPPRLSLPGAELPLNTLMRRSGAIAELLVGTPGPVCVFVRSAEGVMRGAVGALLAGRPLAILDPHLGGGAIASMLSRLEVTTTIDAPPEFGQALPNVAVVGEQEAAFRPLQVDPSDPAWLSLTSGTTGTSRVVVQSHAEVRSAAISAPADDDLAADDVLGVMLGTSMIRFILQFVARGGSVAIGDPRREQLAGVLNRLAAQEVSYLRLVPTTLRWLCQGLPRGTNLPSLRRVASLGEQLRWADVALARERLAPDITLINRYGMTEAPARMSYTVAPEAPIGEGAVPIGRPRRGATVWIDAGDGRPSPTGTPGEIVLDGAFLRGGPAYEELLGGLRRYRTRDRGIMDTAGDVTFLGRLDRLVKVGGVRIDLGDIEALLRAVAGVLDAAVVEGASPARTTEHGEVITLAAHVVVSDTHPPAVDLLEATVRDGMHRNAVPATFQLRTTPLPTLPNGKIDLQRLRNDMDLSAG